MHGYYKNKAYVRRNIKKGLYYGIEGFFLLLFGASLGILMTQCDSYTQRFGSNIQLFKDYCQKNTELIGDSTYLERKTENSLENRL